ncbi:MAG: 30S ribosomal protein THX [Bacteroidota bacterium]
MGKGDKKSRKGKIAMGSYGVTRPRKKSKGAASSAKSKTAPKAATPKKAAAPKKIAAKKAPAKKAK